MRPADKMTEATSLASYDEDFLVWTQQQAAALRRHRSLANHIDIAHVAEEIEDLGRRDLREVRSFLRLIFVYLLEINAFPTSSDVPHWRSEARAFRRSAADAFTPGMRQLIVLADEWRDANRDAAADLRDRGIVALAVTQTCPFALDGLLSDCFDLDHALAKIAITAPSDAPGQS